MVIEDYIFLVLILLHYTNSCIVLWSTSHYCKIIGHPLKQYLFIFLCSYYRKSNELRLTHIISHFNKRGLLPSNVTYLFCNQGLLRCTILYIVGIALELPMLFYYRFKLFTLWWLLKWEISGWGRQFSCDLVFWVKWRSAIARFS